MIPKIIIQVLLLEIGLHYFYFNAFNERELWISHRFEANWMMFTVFWVLNFIYLKFLIIWRVRTYTYRGY